MSKSLAAKSYIGIALAIDFLKLRVRVVASQQMIQKRSERDFLIHRHVLKRTRSEVLRLTGHRI